MGLKIIKYQTVIYYGIVKPWRALIKYCRLIIHSQYQIKGKRNYNTFFFNS